ncbi:MAG: alpha/beta hydrolase [Muribaculaceae bacterium]|nr:alpha/beta hydrolase [Muribaculaceae bacterium]
MKHILTLLVASLIAGTVFANWHADELGHGYISRTVNQPDDYSGRVISTIIARDTLVAGGKGVLYIHGFNDYFFQAALGDSIVAHGWNFRAVDLRKYGRSLLEGQKRYQIRNINEYYPDIDSALVDMSSAGIDTIVIMAHSTGGLVASMYLNKVAAPDVYGLILNSPFLEWNMNGFMRKVAVPVVGFLGSIFPNMKINQGVSTAYSHSLLRQYGGQWDYDTTKKLIVSPAVSAGWIHAIESAQNWLHKHSDIRVPILLMHSLNSVDGSEASQGDAVLNVEHISQLGKHLGPDVEEVTINGGLHDLILSAPAARDSAYRAIFTFLKQF